jgi:hypothetical protein
MSERHEKNVVCMLTLRFAPGASVGDIGAILPRLAKELLVEFGPPETLVADALPQSGVFAHLPPMPDWRVVTGNWTLFLTALPQRRPGRPNRSGMIRFQK